MLLWCEGHTSQAKLHFFKPMFAQTINFVDDVLEYDYQELANNLITNLITIGAICAVIMGAIYNQLRKVKFATPYQIGNQFYFGVNLTPSGDNDERFGISIKDYYLGLYGNQLCWGKLDENGSLPD